MSTKRLVLEKFLEIVGHTDQVQLDIPVLQVDPGRMDISKDHTVLMDVGEPLAKLPKSRNCLAQREWPFAECFP